MWNRSNIYADLTHMTAKHGGMQARADLDPFGPIWKPWQKFEVPNVQFETLWTKTRTWEKFMDRCWNWLFYISLFTNGANI